MSFTSDHPMIGNITKYGSYITVVAAIIIASMTFGINDNGFRTVVQWPNGKTFVKFEPGIYFDWFGQTWVYPDVVTEDFDCLDEESPGITVRYQDGGTGHVCGIARISLPDDEATMLEVHREFRSPEGINAKFFRPTLKESSNLTAGLMTSEEAYAVKRADYAAWTQDQFENGTYKTKLVQVEVEVEPAKYDEETGKLLREAVMREKEVPQILTHPDTGQPMHNDADISRYNFAVTSFSMNDWRFEQRTLEQIQRKREAEMAIITSKADAEKAKQEEQQAVAEGLRNVAKEKYAKEVIKIAAVVEAEKEAEVAEIKAAQQVAVNHQNYLAQVEDVKAAEQEAIAIELRTTAEAEAKERNMLADGALQAKLDAYVKVQQAYAQNLPRQKWSPEIVMASGSGDGAAANGISQASQFMDILTTKALRDLSLDMGIKGDTIDEKGLLSSRD